MKYEIKKLLFRKEVWIVFFLSVAAIILLNLRQPWASVSTIKSAHQKTAEYYSLSLDESENKIVQDLKRNLSDTDIDILSQMQNSIQSYKKQEENMKNLLAMMYRNKKHTSTDFERRDLELAIKQYNRKIDYYICDSKQLHLAFLWMNDFKTFHYLFLLIICTLIAPLFSVESECGMYQILYISQKGKRQLFYNKIISGIFCSACLSICYTFLTFVILWIRFGLSFQLIFAPIQCAEYYKNCPFSISIMQFLLLTTVMRTIIGALVISITAITSCYFKRTGIIFGLTMGICGIMLFISEYFENAPEFNLFMQKLGLFRLPLLGNYLTEYVTVDVIGYPVNQIWLTIICTCSIIFVILTFAYTIYTLPIKTRKEKVKKCSPLMD